MIVMIEDATFEAKERFRFVPSVYKMAQTSSGNQLYNITLYHVEGITVTNRHIAVESDTEELSTIDITPNDYSKVVIL